MRADVTGFRLKMDSMTLARFMPMHLLLDADGCALSYGPTLALVLQDDARLGARFEDLFEVRSPGGAVTIQDVLARAGTRFRLSPRNGARSGLRGHGQSLPGDGRILLNLTFIDLIAAVRAIALSDADFAASDLAREVLFLAEANAAVTQELRGLSLRLEGARMAAEEEAMTDPLTGLRNRRAVDLVLDRLCTGRANFGLLHLDLDFFKAVNDTLGHAAGDFVLESVGRILREQIRAEDCAARIGGDEFVLIVAGRTDPRTLQRIADRIIARIREPMTFEGQECRVSASIGIVRSVNSAAAGAPALSAAADRALYAAKHAGRGRAVMLE
ncbi:diguanylate cyclase [Tabrizicola sp.]|jgi:diguanylate cyclase (GGDEF)-like protein|uniref:GGDEF domain-containing protein n=1 Tax=Tabrizicola sp. TaxID=2005166 RepID=UPI0025EFF8ED|nr:GGDEF domain-containing protein [Tabrizicola sp.]MDK2774791.1 GGDEF domain-containing protein [Tabrizicola sp.]